MRRGREGARALWAAAFPFYFFLSTFYLSLIFSPPTAYYSGVRVSGNMSPDGSSRFSSGGGMFLARRCREKELGGGPVEGFTKAGVPVVMMARLFALPMSPLKPRPTVTLEYARDGLAWFWALVRCDASPDEMEVIRDQF